MRLIHCTLVVKSFHIEKHSLSRHLVFYNEAVDIEDIREWVRSAYDKTCACSLFVYASSEQVALSAMRHKQSKSLFHCFYCV